MQPQILVVSDPPHENVDYDAAAVILGLDVADANLKFTFPAPEVLSASNTSRAAEISEALDAAGVSVTVINGYDLAALPWPAIVSSFEFGGEALRAQTRDGVVTVPYDAPVLATFCKPPSDFRVPADSAGATDAPSRGVGAARAIEWMSSLDLYHRRDGALTRITIVEGLTDFSGLGDAIRGTPEEDMSATVAECGQRFSSFVMDARLRNVRPRQRFVMGEAGFDIDLRKAFSFGTLLLQQVLDSISPDLRDLTQYELASRLAYVLSRSR